MCENPLFVLSDSNSEPSYNPNPVRSHTTAANQANHIGRQANGYMNR